MKVQRGDVYRFKNDDNYLVIAENKRLTDDDDKVKVQWSMTRSEGDFYDYTKQKLEDLTVRTGENVRIANNGYISQVDHKLGFKHDCNHEIVSSKDFFSLSGQWAKDVFNGVLIHIIQNTVSTVAGLLASIYTIYKQYQSLRNFSPEKWFSGILTAPTESYEYRCSRCDSKIDFHTS